MMNKLLFVLHHYAAPSKNTQYHSAKPEMKEKRVQSLSDCITSIWHTFGGRRFDTVYMNNKVDFKPLASKWSPEVVVCVCPDKHILPDLQIPSDLYQVRVFDVDPLFLGFAAHKVIAEASGYAFYCQIEDDLILSDPLFFDKLGWFNGHFGDDRLLVPNRYEVRDGKKCFIDGYAGMNNFNKQEVTLPFLNGEVTFRTPDNVYAGSYFLNQGQLDRVRERGDYLGEDHSWIGPLESSMSLSILKSLQVYKPVMESGFLEIRHSGDRYVGVIV